MDDDLKRRFLLQKLEDLLSDNSKLLPTILCEMDDPRIIELIRPYCCLEGVLKPFRIGGNLKIVSERLDRVKGTREKGELYIDVYIN